MVLFLCMSVCLVCGFPRLYIRADGLALIRGNKFQTDHELVFFFQHGSSYIDHYIYCSIFIRWRQLHDPTPFHLQRNHLASQHIRFPKRRGYDQEYAFSFCAYMKPNQCHQSREIYDDIFPHQMSYFSLVVKPLQQRPSSHTTCKTISMSRGGGVRLEYLIK